MVSDTLCTICIGSDSDWEREKEERREARKVYQAVLVMEKEKAKEKAKRYHPREARLYCLATEERGEPSFQTRWLDCADDDITYQYRDSFDKVFWPTLDLAIKRGSLWTKFVGGKSEAKVGLASVSSNLSPGTSSTRCNDVTHLSIRFKSKTEHCILYGMLNVVGASNRKAKKCKKELRKEKLTHYGFEQIARHCAGFLRVSLPHRKDIVDVDRLLALQGTPLKLLLLEGVNSVSVDLEKGLLYDCGQDYVQRLNKGSLRASGFIMNISEVREVHK